MESRKVIACIQVRMGSSRLPGKALLKIQGKTSIEWIVERLKHAKEIDGIVLITSANPENDELISEAERLGIGWYREQDENDLISRYLNALKKFEADAFVRVTGDCPLVDAGLVDQLVHIYRENPNDYDALTNASPPSFPDGSDLDVITERVLKRIDREIPVGDIHREWVTPYLFAQDRDFRVYRLTSERPLGGYRITLDFSEDLELITKIFEHFGDHYFGLDEIIDYLDAHPEIRGIVENRIETAIVPASNQRSAVYQDLVENPKS